MTKNITVDSGGGGEEVTQEKLQEKLMVFQLMERQLESLRQQGMMLEQRLIEIETSKAALDEIDKLKQGNEALIPLGSGLFTNATISGKKVMTEIGSGLMEEKSAKDAKAFLESRQKELEKAGMELGGEMQKISNDLQRMGPELQEMASKIRANG